MMLRSVTLVRTDVSEERIASIIKVAIIGELGGPPKHRFLQESHGVESHKTEFFIVINVKSYSASCNLFGDNCYGGDNKFTSNTQYSEHGIVFV
jgi:hypothetical protein